MNRKQEIAALKDDVQKMRLGIQAAIEMSGEGDEDVVAFREILEEMLLRLMVLESQEERL